MGRADELPRYDSAQTYAWNYEHAPDPVEIEIPEFPGSWSFCGMPVDSPLGMPAGPLLNGKWILYYASLGFDVLTYKTVRSGARECYALPNLVHVTSGPLRGGEQSLPASPEATGSWAVSFGMPSKGPEEWRRDVEATRQRLPKGKLLSVSVVGTMQEEFSLEDLADDYARCASWAVESGADCVETNFSCPNVCTRDGQLYEEHPAARVVAERVRSAIGTTPYVIKIGHVTDPAAAESLIAAVGSSADALAMTNSVATTITAPDGSPYFEGAQRGICGAATREASLQQTALFRERLEASQVELELVGVGGISTAAHVRAQLEAGAVGVQIATAAMLDPLVACRIREEWGNAETKTA